MRNPLLLWNVIIFFFFRSVGFPLYVFIDTMVMRFSLFFSFCVCGARVYYSFPTVWAAAASSSGIFLSLYYSLRVASSFCCCFLWEFSWAASLSLLYPSRAARAPFLFFKGKNKELPKNPASFSHPFFFLNLISLWLIIQMSDRTYLNVKEILPNADWI